MSTRYQNLYLVVPRFLDTLASCWFEQQSAFLAPPNNITTIALFGGNLDMKVFHACSSSSSYFYLVADLDCYYAGLRNSRERWLVSKKKMATFTFTYK